METQEQRKIHLFERRDGETILQLEERIAATLDGADLVPIEICLTVDPGEPGYIGTLVVGLIAHNRGARKGAP